MQKHRTIVENKAFLHLFTIRYVQNSFWAQMCMVQEFVQLK